MNWFVISINPVEIVFAVIMIGVLAVSYAIYGVRWFLDKLGL